MYSQGYFIDVQICIVVLYLLYIAFFHRHILHSVARLYLLLLVPVSLLIPILDLPLLPAVKSVGEVVVGSVVEMRPQIEYVTDDSVNYYNLIYSVGVGVMLLWSLMGFIKLFILLKSNRIEKIAEQKIIFIKGEIYAFTVLNYIFINEKFRDTASASELIAHEMEHVKMHHSFDLLYVNLLRVLFWFNPIVWHIQLLLRQLHEYQVDRRVIDNGYSLVSYINLLIKSEAGINPEFTSSFGYSFTKKRIVMLVEKKRINNCMRLFIALPVLGSLLFTFSLTTRASVEQEAMINRQDTLLRTVNTSLDDLLILYDWKIITKKEMDALDMKKIKSFSVLKNKAGQDLYGERGKNGVIIIESMNGESLKTEGNEVVISSANSVSTVKFNIVPTTYIIDGMQATEKEYKQLMMADIKSVTVLKDSVARAIYGSKGKNGVVIVETNRLQADPKDVSEVVVTGIPRNKSTGTIISVKQKIRPKSETVLKDTGNKIN